MRLFTALLIYRLLLPLLFVAAFPGWVLKMLRRGGFGTRLGERVAVYTVPLEFEPSAAVHVHAVSVGESLLALKLIREWRVRDPEQRFVLATGTATGHAVATAAEVPGLRVTYSPLDFRWMVRRYLKRFEPSQIVLIEAEAWPHLLLACRKMGIRVSLVNARMSPRSARRYRKFAAWIRPVFSLLDAVAVQEPEDAAIWQDLGVEARRIHPTGSLKFDPGIAKPSKRPEFQQMLDAFGKRPVILAASTHAGEDAWIAAAIRRAVPDALPVIVPRHAERRAEVTHELEREGFAVTLRSGFESPVTEDGRPQLFLIDSTGELRDWTAHADVVIIGKSFLESGGQNPCEAILAGRPVVFGPHMENFEPLASRLVAAQGCIRATDENELTAAIMRALDPQSAQGLTRNASHVLASHEGATRRILDLLGASTSPLK
jgi:3-deoxy-D-manno-octulosonic-acid transferase